MFHRAPASLGLRSFPVRSETNGLRDRDREGVRVVALVGLHDHLLVVRDRQDVVRAGHRAGRYDGLR